uniref:Uncharacterized protein n=1 Tax=Anolis carolinensis TaxID=28377 RepID=H9G733_ANOCA
MVQLSDGDAGLPEWVLMELQGELEARSGAGLEEKLLGDLHYTKEKTSLLPPPYDVPSHLDTFIY